MGRQFIKITAMYYAMNLELLCKVFPFFLLLKIIEIEDTLIITQGYDSVINLVLNLHPTLLV
jgi:hypothetical protein